VGKRTCWEGYLRLNACNQIKVVGEKGWREEDS
jgi:hypothetical protein